MADIPEEAVERASEEVWSVLVPGVPVTPQPLHVEAAVRALQASGALFLTDEEKRALVALAEAAWPYSDTVASARQKLEESLGPDRIRNG